MRNGFCVLLPIGYLCVMKKLFTTIYITLLCLDCMAQRQTVVADMDTRLPIAGAVVSTAGGKRLTTDYTGRFGSALPIKSATISKKHYMQRRVSDTELRQDHLPHPAGGGAQRRGGDGARIQLQYAEGAAKH